MMIKHWPRLLRLFKYTDSDKKASTGTWLVPVLASVRDYYLFWPFWNVLMASLRSSTLVSGSAASTMLLPAAER